MSHGSFRWALTLACLTAAGCGEAASAPDGELLLEVVDAPASGTPGFAVEGLLLRVVGSDGLPRRDVEVRLEASDGGGVEPAVATSTVDGLLAVTWRLGLVVGPQVLTAHPRAGTALRIPLDARAFRVDDLEVDFLFACGLAQSEVWCWQRSVENVPGRYFNPPTRFMPGRHVRALAVSGSYVCALDPAGVAWCRNRFLPGPEEQVSGTPPLALIDAGNRQFCGVAAGDGTPWCWDFFGGGAPQPRQVSSSLRLSSISVGGGSTGPFACGIDVGGSAWCWGRGEEGQLGDGASASSEAPVLVAGGLRFQQVSAGSAHACGTVPGALYCWGDSASLALRRPHSSVPSPAGVEGVRISMGYTGGMVTASGVTTQWGGGIGQGFPTPQVLQQVSGLERLVFRDVRAGESACAIGPDGSAWCSADVFFYETPNYLGPAWLAVPEPDVAAAQQRRPPVAEDEGS